jgi:transposase-like protein
MTIEQIDKNFPDEIDCIKYFEKIRWSDKPQCVYCNSYRLVDRTADYRFNCKSCNKSTSVTSKTKLHNTRLPLKVWLNAFSLVAYANKKVSARKLQRTLNVSYPTAWEMNKLIKQLLQHKFDYKPYGSEKQSYHRYCSFW